MLTKCKLYGRFTGLFLLLFYAVLSDKYPFKGYLLGFWNVVISWRNGFAVPTCAYCNAYLGSSLHSFFVFFVTRKQRNFESLAACILLLLIGLCYFVILIILSDKGQIQGHLTDFWNVFVRGAISVSAALCACCNACLGGGLHSVYCSVLATLKPFNFVY